jgi:DNA polymerase III epsilon subunit-like protein
MARLIFVDTETTGTEPGKDAICQVCYREGNELFTEYFRPKIPIPVKAMSIHHITNDMVADKPAFAGSTFEQDLSRRLADGIMVAHNASFDRAMLEAEGVQIKRFICTYRVAYALDTADAIPEYNLQYLRYHLKLRIEGRAHDAEGDVNVLYALFQYLLRDLMRLRNCSEETAISEMEKITTTPLLLRKFNFGKYRGRSISEIAATDRGYLQWLLGKKLDSGENDENWIYTLRHYLGP